MDDSREGTPSMYLKADDGPIPVLEWDNQSIESVLTGEDDTRAQTVFLRHRDEIGAMGAGLRLRTKLRTLAGKICCRRPGLTSDEKLKGVLGDAEEGREKQYRLASANRNPSVGLLRRYLCCTSNQSTLGGLGVSPNQAIALSLHWMFRVNFFVLFTLSCVIFFGLVILFSALIILAGSLESDCVRIGGKSFGESEAAFANAFTLSWTTLSTVGYGSTYPAVAHENDSRTNCLFITGICSLESFIGVLYSGFCGAILFGKILRIQSHAQVLFSDPIVIRYGNGLDQNSGVDAELDEGTPEDFGNKKRKPKIKRIACPVLEFRIVNRLFDEVGGEIMDATLNVVANVDANEVDPVVSERTSSVRQDSSASKSFYFKRSGVQDSASVRSASTTRSDHNGDENSQRTTVASLQSNTDTLLSRIAVRKFLDIAVASRHVHEADQHVIEHEDPSSHLVSKHIFATMMIQAGEHPFFKRVWLARHVLDDTSPLLTPRTRRLIRKCDGYWPEHLNNYEGVRQSLKFNQILVSLNGVSNVSASDVYAQKIYDFIDVNIGYQFVNLLYRGDSDQLKVDVDLINDVREQMGGGGEPLTMGE